MTLGNWRLNEGFSLHVTSGGIILSLSVNYWRRKTDMITPNTSKANSLTLLQPVPAGDSLHAENLILRTRFEVVKDF